MSLTYPLTVRNSNTYIRFAPKTAVNITENKTDDSGTGELKQKKVTHSTKQDGVIYLYLPPTLKSDSNIEWTEEDTRIYGQINDVLSSNNMWDAMAGKLKGHGLEAFINIMTGGTVQDLASKKRGLISNPERDIFFKGIGFREFQFSFDFYPESQQEAENVRNIILTFKKYSLPNFSGNKAFLTYPPVWEIQAITEKQKLQEFKSCYLTRTSFDYAPDQIVSLFKDGKPVHIRMDLTFKESELVTQSDYNRVNSLFGY